MTGLASETGVGSPPAVGVGAGVAVAVGVAVRVAVAVEPLVGIGVDVAVAVRVGVCAGVGVIVGAGVGVIVGGSLDGACKTTCTPTLVVASLMSTVSTRVAPVATGNASTQAIPRPLFWSVASIHPCEGEEKAPEESVA